MTIDNIIYTGVEKVKMLMDLNNMTLVELASKADIAPGVLSRILNHKSNGSITSWLKIAAALNIELNKLFS